MSEPGSRRGLTYADYAALPDDGTRYQLVEGELVVNPSPTRWHQVVLGEIFTRLHAHVREHDLGEVDFAPLDTVLSERNVFQPDILFVSHARTGILRDANVAGAPDLCVEILSPSTASLDRVKKRELYARHGVLHYWIVDLDARAIDEYVLEDGVLALRGRSSEDDVFRPAVFPGFEFRLRDAGLPAK